MRAAGVDDEAAQGDVQLHQEPAPGGGRPLGTPVGAHVDHGQRQPPGGDHPEPPPVTRPPRPGARGPASSACYLASCRRRRRTGELACSIATTTTLIMFLCF